jgi:hypothetical protein
MRKMIGERKGTGGSKLLKRKGGNGGSETGGRLSPSQSIQGSRGVVVLTEKRDKRRRGGKGTTGKGREKSGSETSAEDSTKFNNQ